jgi:DNA-binding response OmpR family regulator
MILNSEQGKGTTITFTLPAPDLTFLSENSNSEIELRESPGLELMEEFESESPPKVGESAPLVLIVEDDLELRVYLRKMLWKYYRTEESENGSVGIIKARSMLPDLIISDIMMPEMSGIEMCQQLKRDPETEHIPIILLSAKSGIESKIDGFEKGADEYLEKPFSSKHLLTRARNLIESRERLKLHFNNSPHQKPKIAGINTYDREFLEKVFYKIEQNISNPEFNVKELSSELGMSRVHLYRRFKNLTGKMPKEFMNESRLKAASALLEENRLSISEVAYKVGFNTPSNFTASFKAYYGISPKNYKSS